MAKEKDIIAAILTVPVALRMDSAHMDNVLRVFGKIKRRLGEKWKE